MSATADALLAALRHRGAAGAVAAAARRRRSRRARGGQPALPRLRRRRNPARRRLRGARPRLGHLRARRSPTSRSTERPDAFTVAYARRLPRAGAPALPRRASRAAPTARSASRPRRCRTAISRPTAAASSSCTPRRRPARRRRSSTATAAARRPPSRPDRPVAAVPVDPRDHPPRRRRSTSTCRLEGEEFEMEDQRNWSDASFKTYGRPLALPWPFVLPAGVPVPQSVAVAVRAAAGAAPAAPPRSDRSRSRSAHRPARASRRSAWSSRPAEVAAALAALDRLAEIGAAAHPLRLRSRPPATAPDALRRLRRAAGGLPGGLRPRMRRRRRGRPRRRARRRRRGGAPAGLRLASVAVCPAVDRKSTPPGSAWPACPPLDEIYAAARAAFPGLPLGGGMFSYFTELNRKRPPLELLDFVTHATNPIVHAADDDSVMETLEALPHITRSARAIIGDRRYRIGPSTIAMRQNPYGARTMPNPRRRARLHGRRRPAPARPLRRRLDRRLRRRDRARRTSRSGCPAAFTGPRGLLDDDGEPAAGRRGGARPRAARRGRGAARPARRLPRRFAVLATRAGGATRAWPRTSAARAASLRRSVTRPFEARCWRNRMTQGHGHDRSALRTPGDERRPGGDKIVRRKLSDQVLERMQELILARRDRPPARRCRPSTS